MEKQLSFKNGVINYRAMGQGPAIVLLHGFLENQSIWDDCAGKLEKNYRVLAIDLPGFGKSSVFGEVHSMAFMAGAVHTVLRAEEIKKAFLVGHSMGGYVSLAFARLYPQQLKGVVLFHSQAAADDDQGKINRERTVKLVQGSHRDFIHGFIPTLFCEERVENYSDEIESLREQSMQTPVEGITAALLGMRDREDSRELLRAIEVPVFFIIGKKDAKIALQNILDQIVVQHSLIDSIHRHLRPLAITVKIPGQSRINLRV